MIDGDLFYIKSEYVLFKLESTAHESLQITTDEEWWCQLTQLLSKVNSMPSADKTRLLSSVPRAR